MKSGALVTIVLALLVLWASVTGRLSCFASLWSCMNSGAAGQGSGGTSGGSAAPGGSTGLLPNLPGLF